MANISNIGFIGMGKMGLAMAANLQNYRVANNLPSIGVYNRTPSKCQPVVEAGATAYDSPAELASNSGVVFLCLFNDDAVKQVVSEILSESAARDKLVIADSTTVHPDTTEWVLQQIQDQGAADRIEFVQAPVWGAPPAAIAAKLVLVLGSNNAETRSQLKEIAVPSFARVAIECAGTPAEPNGMVRAAKFKILGNNMISSIIESLGESMAVAHKTGVGRKMYLDFIKEVLPVAPVVGYARKMVEEDGEAAKTQIAFTVDGGMKDVGYAIDVAKDVGMRLPVAELAYEHLQWVKDNGDAGWDWSSLPYALLKK